MYGHNIYIINVNQFFNLTWGAAGEVRLQSTQRENREPNRPKTIGPRRTTSHRTPPQSNIQLFQILFFPQILIYYIWRNRVYTIILTLIFFFVTSTCVRVKTTITTSNRTSRRVWLANRQSGTRYHV